MGMTQASEPHAATHSQSACAMNTALIQFYTITLSPGCSRLFVCGTALLGKAENLVLYIYILITVSEILESKLLSRIVPLNSNELAENLQLICCRLRSGYETPKVTTSVIVSLLWPIQRPISRIQHDRCPLYQASPLSYQAQGPINSALEHRTTSRFPPYE